MILEIKEERKIERYSKYFVNWTKSEFEELVRLTKKARVKKDGTFSLTLAVQITLVFPDSISTEPSACILKSLVIFISLN